MASRCIAAASSGGKSVFDYAEILRSAHRQARQLLTYGCFRGTYRQALAAGLCLAWRAAKGAIAEAEWQAAQPKIPQGIADRVRAMRAEAWWEPINARGNERYSAILDRARDIEDAARAAAGAVL